MRPDPIDILTKLVAAKSYSGDEGPAADVLAAWLRAHGVTPRRIGHNIVCIKGRGARGLLFNSHLDTVPATDRWTRDPWTPGIEGDWLYGLGSTDAKSCVAAMAAAFVAAPDPGDAGRVIFSATTEEETGGMGHKNGMELTLPDLLPLAGAVVGEPTELNIATSQRGLVRIILHSRGQAGHASRPWEGRNAIEGAAADVLALKELSGEITGPSRDSRGSVATIQATLISGGSAKNVIPDHVATTLDCRTTRGLDNAALIARIRDTVAAELEVISDRFRPVETAASADVIRAAQSALPEAELRAFGGVSDLYFLTSIPDAPVPCCLIGPGSGRQSHQPDEYVSVHMVRKAGSAYTGIATRFFEEPVDGN